MNKVNNNLSESLEMEIRSSEFFDATLSTENPVQREYQEEVLLHSPENIELHTKNLPLLMNHDPNEQVGVVEGIKIIGKRLVGKVRLGNSPIAQAMLQDIKDGIRENLSIGYQILHSYINDEGQRIVDKFKVLEASLVSIPADKSAGIGRSVSCINNNGRFFVRSLATQRVSNMETKREIRSERERVNEILALADQHNKRELGKEAIESGYSVSEFRAELLDEIQTRPISFGGSSYNAEEYSVVRALQGLEDVTKRGYEWEVSKDLERNHPKTNPNSIILDTRVMTGSSTTTQTSVASNIEPFLQQKSVIANLNTRNFDGLVGDLTIPVGNSASGFTAITTDGTTQVAQTDIAIASKTLTAHRFGDVVPLSYGLLQQATPDVESFVRNNLADTFAKNRDDQIIGGSGSSGNVTGILNTTGINAVSNSGTEVTFANFLSALSLIGADEVNLSNVALIINPANIDNLVSAVKYSSTASPLLDMEIGEGGLVGSMMGFPVYASTKISADNYLMGDFSYLAVGNWGGIEVAMNPFYDDRRFIQSLNAIITFDSVVLNPNAFCLITKA